MPDLETSLSYCTFCPKLCRHVCPVSNAEARETIVPQAKMATMRLLRTGALATTVENADALYACTGCLACTVACHHEITPGRHLVTGRADVVRAEAGHPALADLPARVRAVATRAAAETRAVAPDRVRADAEVALVPSCTDPGLAAATLRLLDRAGTDAPVALAALDLGCGGYPLLAGGFTGAFRLHAETVARQLAGHARVLVSCPACAVVMRDEYPRHGVALRAEVLHPLELLGSLVEKLPQRAGEGATAFYHDPCYLGRHRGTYDAPRQLLARAGVRVREFSRSRAEAECSGGGGLVRETAPATSAAIAEHRLEEVREAGVGLIVTACATCKRQLGRGGVVARDVIEVVEEVTR